ncbi:MAG TPA: hypothetical protein VJA47_01140, partial [archaeon]|nr:hypothetical protein [archaeon]
HHQLARIKSRTESLPLSWIHSGGVKQLFGYLTDMRYGFASIGLQNHLFASDRPTFFEARHMNDLAMKYLVEKLDQYCRSRGIEVDSREGGRRYDEHIFLGFGDPALDVRIRRDPNSVPLLGKGMEVDRVGNRKGYRFSVTVNKDCTLNTGASAEKPVISPPVFLLPEKIKSLQNVRATEGLKYHIGDDFVVFDIGSNIVVENGSAKLVPTQLAAGQTWELSFTS